MFDTIQQYHFESQELIAALGRNHAAIERLRRETMSYFTDLKAAIADNTNLVTQVLQKLNTAPVEGTPDEELAPLVAALTASNAAVAAALAPVVDTPAPVDQPVGTDPVITVDPSLPAV